VYATELPAATVFEIGATFEMLKYGLGQNINVP
jgi:hypothetical protein